MDITRVNQSDICPVHVFLGEERLWVYSSRLIPSLDSKPACVCFLLALGIRFKSMFIAAV